MRKRLEGSAAILCYNSSVALNIEITPEAESRLRRQAQAVDKDVRVFVAEIVETAAAKSNLDEVLAPLRKQFAETGVSDEELIRDITDAQAEYRAQKQKKPA